MFHVAHLTRDALSGTVCTATALLAACHSRRGAFRNSVTRTFRTALESTFRAAYKCRRKIARYPFYAARHSTGDIRATSAYSPHGIRGSSYATARALRRTLNKCRFYSRIIAPSAQRALRRVLSRRAFMRDPSTPASWSRRVRGSSAVARRGRCSTAGGSGR